jgi:hypothetical protein
VGNFRLNDRVIGVQEVAVFAFVIAFLTIRWKQLFGSALREEEI